MFSQKLREVNLFFLYLLLYAVNYCYIMNLKQNETKAAAQWKIYNLIIAFSNKGIRY